MLVNEDRRLLSDFSEKEDTTEQIHNARTAACQSIENRYYISSSR